MCKPKSEGGQRCFAHAAGTKAALNYVHAKTGIDKKQIYAIMKELNKEGRKLENPTPEEIEKYFSLEEFKTKYDTSLTEKEKVTILKQLVSARAEAEAQEVRPGVFHAWKNALTRAVQRFKKPFIGLTLTGTLLFTASCSAGVIEPNNTKGPEETKTPVAATCTIENPDELGDVVALEEITDEHGTYCHVTVSPDAKDGYLTLDTVENGQALKDAGFTDEDLIKAQDVAYKIAIEETLDGGRLDTTSQSIPEYYKDNLRDLIDPSAQATYDRIVKEYPDANLGLIVTDSFAGPLIRDGQPRVESVSIKTSGISAEKVAEGADQEAGTDYLYLTVNSVGLYRSSDQNIISTIQKNHPDMSLESIKDQNPDLFDEDTNSYYALSSTQNFAFKKGNALIGTRIEYNLLTYSASNTILTK